MLATFSIAYTRLRQWGYPGGPPITVTTTSTTTTTSSTTDPDSLTWTTDTYTVTPPWNEPINFETETTTDPVFVPTSATTPNNVLTTENSTTTEEGGTPHADIPVFTPYPDAIVGHVLHTKFWPKYNDEALISHADDRVREQGRATSTVDGPNVGEDGAATVSILSSGPHEKTGFPIGNSVESYQGFKTVEVHIRQIHISIPDTDGNVLVQDWGATTGEWGLLYTERNIEKLKIIEWATVGSSSWQIDFYFRTKRYSKRVHRVSTYVHVAWHDSCESS